jgi:hypothetical protein
MFDFRCIILGHWWTLDYISGSVIDVLEVRLRYSIFMHVVSE